MRPSDTKGTGMKLIKGAGALLGLVMAMPAFAQDAAPTLNSGDTAWMLTSALLVLLMILPGLQLFYGGLARTKNMLSVMT